MKAILPAALLLAMFACGDRSAPAAPSPLPDGPPALLPVATARIDGVWIMNNQLGVDDPSLGVTGSVRRVPTTWTLVQSGSEVTGTSLRVAPFVVSDNGTITGTVTGNDVKLSWINVIELANANSCNPSTTNTAATMVVSGETMTGHLVTRQGGCASRTFGGQQYTFTRQAIPLPPQPAPAAIALAVTYRHRRSPNFQGSTGCSHHYTPSNLFIHIDGLPSPVRLAPADERLSRATIEGAWPGEHWMMFVDTDLCPVSEAGPAPYVTSGVSINGDELSRVVQLQFPGDADRRPALAFTLSADGTVEP